MTENYENRQLRFLNKSSKYLTNRAIIILVFVLMALPFWSVFQDILTRAVINIKWYKYIQEYIVPYQLKVVGVLLSNLGIPARVGKTYFEIPISGGGSSLVYLIWNCVGWQTFVLFWVTLITGLSGKFTLTSKVETLIIGILGTYVVNIFRLVMVVAVYSLFRKSFGLVFHDYFSNIFTIFWIFGFWWFASNFVLERKEGPDLFNREQS